MEVYDVGTEQEIKYITNEPVKNPLADTKRVMNHVLSNMEDALTHHKSLGNCPPTPLYDLGRMSGGVGRAFLKDEGKRMGMMAFKVLGAPYSVHCLARQGIIKPGDTLTTMTDGNHGVAVAMAARDGGYKAVIYVPDDMKEDRRKRITSLGAELVVVDGNYDGATDLVKIEAAKHGWHVISDTSWRGYEEIPLFITAGYTTLFDEAVSEMKTEYGLTPTHIIIQTGVGSLGAGGMIHALSKVQPTPVFVSVEPHDADCMLENFRLSGDGTLASQGKAQSMMAGLNCPTPAITAWPVYRDYCTAFVALGDQWPKEAMRELYTYPEKIVSGESGCAGYAALVAARHNDHLKVALKLDEQSVILLINTEAATDSVNYNKVLGQNII